MLLFHLSMLFKVIRYNAVVPVSFVNKVAVAGTEVVEAGGAEEGGTEVVEVEEEVPIGTTVGQRSPLRRLWR